MIVARPGAGRALVSLGPMGRLRWRWWCVGTAVLLVAACSGGDDGNDGDGGGGLTGDDLTEATDDLFGPEEPPSADLPPADRAAQVADRIATSVGALDLALTPGYEDTIGAPVVDQMRNIGTVLGDSRVALADMDDDEALAYALRLTWDLADRLANPNDPVDRYLWVSAWTLDDARKQELATLLDEGDDAAAVELVTEAEPGVAAGDVVDAAAQELSEIVPVDTEIDTLSALLTSYRSAAELPES